MPKCHMHCFTQFSANLREGAAKEGWGEECAAPERVKRQNKRRLRWRLGGGATLAVLFKVVSSNV